MPTVVKSGSTAREINRMAAIHAIRTHGPVSQAQLSRLTTLSPATVLRLVRQLVAEGLIIEDSTGPSTGGRPPTLLKFNPTAGYVAGVDLGGSHMVGALADLSGKPEQTVRIPTPAADGEDALKGLYQVIDGLLEGAPHLRPSIRAIGIAAPGITRDGVVVHAPALRWREVNLQRLLEDRYGVETLVENDANMIALGELWFGAAQGMRNAVCIVIGTGIGAGLIVDGQLYKGAQQAAGEIGFAVFDRSFLGIEYEKFGCLETFAAGPGIARRAQMLAALGRAKGICRIAGVPEAISAGHVFAAAREGDKDALRLVSETADALAVALINVSVLLDPEVIILGGGVMRSGDLVVERIKEHLRQASVAPPPVVISQLGDEAAMRGAIARALEEEHRYPLLSQILGRSAAALANPGGDSSPRKGAKG